ncbi:hypothetical protein GS504_00935 [Rhodococcus hoagii]|nr:hypothetical protein [Prescottella equi]NKS72193.1 hypothetical protein [Prescottella equi]
MSYWHAFTGTSEDGAQATIVFGPCELGPDNQTDDGTLVRDFTIPTMLGIAATWSAAFDHDPTEKEKNALHPVEVATDYR